MFDFDVDPAVIDAFGERFAWEGGVAEFTPSQQASLLGEHIVRCLRCGRFADGLAERVTLTVGGWLCSRCPVASPPGDVPGVGL
jgi:hypothetical protein